ncbi:hypothetical protein LKD70_17485 [Ruminococcus sp. CLA-AA-H200]|uniref:Uncharacterized protein n=1 Tax=Ruminococcus turbiniformis TaxID=2881258 RepID=A0ABS8G468_9FIRM|nr:hypothetical protein [Ruminococcus turbiniformis]MCC2256177.1 hypothetical protein [Ruminococcus turbiniformis]
MKEGYTTTMIYELKEGSPVACIVAEYSVDPKPALVAYIMQSLYNDYNTWDYPVMVKGMRESDTVKNHWYYDDFANRRVLAAYPV